MYLKILTSIIKVRNPDSAINNLVLLSLRAIEQVISRNMMVIMTFLWCLFFSRTNMCHYELCIGCSESTVHLISGEDPISS